jgi:ribosomal protein L11 methyltransferase
MSRADYSKITEISLRLRHDQTVSLEILKMLFKGLGIGQQEMVERIEWPHSYLSVYCESFQRARGIKARIKKANLRNLTIVSKTLRRKDWQTKWAQDLKPFSLTPRVDVVPMNLKGRYRPPGQGKQPIYIETTMAFGSGLHETTQLMAQLIECCRGRFQSFFDLGTGSGILSIVALKCGAQTLKAIDLNRTVIRIAKQNIRANGFLPGQVTAVDFKKFNVRASFDFVAANLITQELMEMFPKILSLVTPGKYLAVSGISLDHYQLFREHCRVFPLKCLKIRKGEKWAALLYQRLS